MKNLLKGLSLLLIGAIAVSCGESKTQKMMLANIDYTYTQNRIDSTLATGWYYITEPKEGFKRQLDKTDEYYYIHPKPIVVKEHFDKVEIYKADESKNQFALSIQIHSNFEHLWGDATEKWEGKRLALIINNKLVSNPKVMGRINGGGSSLGRPVYSEEELEEFIEQIGI